MAISVKVKIDTNSGVIEIEGPQEFAKEILEKYSSILTKPDAPKKVEKESTKPTEGKVKKASTKGTNITEPINSLVTGNFFNSFKFVEEVVGELVKNGIPNVSRQNVTMALKRKLPGELIREKDATNNKWRYKKK